MTVLRAISPIYFCKANSALLAGFLFISGVFAFCFYGVFSALAGAWYGSSSSSHGFLIPFISLYVVWMKMDVIRSLKPKPGYAAGLIVLSGALFLHIIGRVSAAYIIQEAALIMAVAGTVALVLGRGFLKALIFPIAFLSLMLTSWGTLMEPLHGHFQLFTAAMSENLLSLIGIPVQRESIFLYLPEVTLEVARECSGVNYLIAVASIGIPLAYIALRSWKNRITLVFFALAVAVLANGFRVALIGTLSYFNLSGDLHGPLHTLHAMFVAIIGYIVLFAGVWVLSKREDRGRDGSMHHVKGPVPLVRGEWRAVRLPFFIAVFLMLAAGSVVNLYSPVAAPPRFGLYLPENIGGWTAVKDGATGGFSSPGADAEITRTYRGPGGAEIDLYVGYYNYQDAGKKLVNYSSAVFHENSERVKLRRSGPAAELTVNKAVITHDGERRRILFWYDLNGEIAADRLTAKARMVKNALLKGRTNGALVVLTLRHAEGLGPNEEDFIMGAVEALKGIYGQNNAPSY